MEKDKVKEVEEEKEEVEEVEVEEEKEEVEVDEKTVKSISDRVLEKVKPELKVISETVKVKSQGIDGEKEEAEVEGEVSKEVRLGQFISKLANEPIHKTLQTTTTYDELVLPTEFMTEIQRLEEEYGVALRDAYVKRTDRTSVTVPKKTGDLTVYETGEGVQKTESTPTFDQVVITLKKYAAIAPLTDEVTEDTVGDIWRELTDSFARAFAKKADELVFTDPTIGILADTSANIVTMDAAEGFEDVTFDDLSLMVDGVPTDSAKNGKFYFHRTMLGVLRRIKDTTSGQYIWAPGPNGANTGTIWGYPYELVEVMPALSDNATSTAFMVFGDLRRYMLIEKNGIQLKVLEEGTVGEVNLGEQDARALRGVKRMYGSALFSSAFSVLKTNTTIS